jgi:hypothetical protein
MSESPTPRSLAAGVHGVTRGLTLRPWDRYAADESLWWLVPSTEWPAYKHGKFASSKTRADQGEIFAGLNVEKGFGAIVADLFPSVRRRRQTLEQDWAWHRLTAGTEPETFARVLASLGSEHPIRLWLEASYVREPRDYTPPGPEPATGVGYVRLLAEGASLGGGLVPPKCFAASKQSRAFLRSSSGS